LEDRLIGGPRPLTAPIEIHAYDPTWAGYALRLRETDWFEHRLFNGPDTNLNLHTFSSNCPEASRMLIFRDWLRNNADDREMYLRAKMDLASRKWKYMQQYAEAKTGVIQEILARAQVG
jgi:GrpB-like predicted nucleotidyltransferase (UPF0157 family)